MVSLSFDGTYEANPLGAPDRTSTARWGRLCCLWYVGGMVSEEGRPGSPGWGEARFFVREFEVNPAPWKILKIMVNTQIDVHIYIYVYICTYIYLHSYIWKHILYVYTYMLVTVYVPNMLMFVGMHDLAQGDDPDPIDSQPQEKQQLLPEDLPERFYVTWRFGILYIYIYIYISYTRMWYTLYVCSYINK